MSRYIKMTWREKALRLSQRRIARKVAGFMKSATVDELAALAWACFDRAEIEAPNTIGRLSVQKNIVFYAEAEYRRKIRDFEIRL